MVRSGSVRSGSGSFRFVFVFRFGSFFSCSLWFLRFDSHVMFLIRTFRSSLFSLSIRFGFSGPVRIFRSVLAVPETNLYIVNILGQLGVFVVHLGECRQVQAQGLKPRAYSI